MPVRLGFGAGLVLDLEVERDEGAGDWGGSGVEVGLLMPRASEAGGPTGTMREPNSTPMVTSWWGEKRPSQRRMVSWEEC